MDRKKKKTLFAVEEIVVGISAVLLIVGAFLTWGYTPNYSTNGLSGDGTLTIGVGVIALVLLLLDLRQRRLSPWIPLALGIAALIIGGIDFYQMAEAVTKFDGHVGVGLYLTVLASAGIVLGSVIDVVRYRK